MDAWIKNPNRQPMLTPESFKSLFENSPTAMLVEGADGDVRDANASACELFGTELDQLIGRNSTELIPEEPIADTSPETSQRSQSICSKDGTTIRVSTHSAPIENESEAALLISIWPTAKYQPSRDNERIQHDDPGKAPAYNNIQGASRHIANVISDSLTPIQGFVSLVQADLKQGRVRSSHLEQIASAADRGASFARDLFTFSSATAQGTSTLLPGKILSALYAELAEIAGNTVKINCNIPHDSPAISVSHNDFCTIMRHAVANASANAGIKNKRLITISCSSESRSIPNATSSLPSTVIAITDNAPGLSHEVSTRVFEPFHSLPEREDPQGLRLPTIQQLMKNHGGTTQFLSYPGQGNTLKLIFLQCLSGTKAKHMPESPHENERSSHSTSITNHTLQQSPAASPAASKKTILVVEDESTVRETVSRNLQYLGYNVLEAKNGEHGLSMSRLHQDKIDLIFSDIVMPRMSGPAMISLMKKEQIKAPVLYTTGYADAPGLVDEDNVITKPYTTKVLAARIREILDPVEAG